jgi:hypothetical protein
MADIPNLQKQGTRLGNSLTREQAKEMLAVLDHRRSMVSGIALSWHCWSAAPCGDGNLPLYI